MEKLDMNCDDLTKEQIIDVRKQLNMLTKEARAKSRHDTCLLCGKKVDFVIHIQFPSFALKTLLGTEN